MDVDVDVVHARNTRHSYFPCIGTVRWQGMGRYITCRMIGASTKKIGVPTVSGSTLRGNGVQLLDLLF